MRNVFVLCVAFLWMVTASYAQVGITTDNSTPDNSAMLDVKSTTKGFLAPRMTKSNRNTITSPATGLMIYQTDSIPGFYFYNGTAWTALQVQHYIGELFGGGIVFWVDNTGQHGLIVSLVDISTSAPWNTASITTGAISTWNGQANSLMCGCNAAGLCVSYGGGGYSDWYLPAIDQLNLLYNARYILNKNIESLSGANILAQAVYWSSTEYNVTNAWSYRFAYGDAYYNTKSLNNWVRAVRAF